MSKKLSSNALSTISHGLAALLPTVQTQAFSGTLVKLISALVPVSEASVIVYHDDHLPYFDYLIPNARTGHPGLATFIDGAFLLDPYYIAATKNSQQGFFRLKDLAPSGFRNSEYFRVYYRHSGLLDECGYLVPTQGAGFVNIALGRNLERSRFSSHECKILADITPVINQLVRQQWGSKSSSTVVSKSVRRSLETALEHFGESKLTEREAQIVRLILHGHTSKTIAAQLNISVDTVKLHRKNSYAKLEVNMQSELFYLFINSLIKNDHYQSGDPLATMHQESASCNKSLYK